MLKIFWCICCLSNILALSPAAAEPAAEQPLEYVVRRRVEQSREFVLSIPERFIVGQRWNIGGFPELVVDPARHLPRAQRKGIPYITVPPASNIGWSKDGAGQAVLHVKDAQTGRLPRPRRKLAGVYPVSRAIQSIGH